MKTKEKIRKIINKVINRKIINKKPFNLVEILRKKTNTLYIRL